MDNNTNPTNPSQEIQPTPTTPPVPPQPQPTVTQPQQLIAPQPPVAEQATPQQPTVIQPTTPQPPTDMSAQKDSPYYDQQVLPGQVIGYGLPTNQNVVIQPAAKPPRDLKKPILITLTAFIILAAAGGGGYYFLNKDKKTPKNSTPITSQADTSGKAKATTLTPDPTIKAESISTTIPSDWTTTDTNVGYSIKLPKDFKQLGSTDTTSLGDLTGKGSVYLSQIGASISAFNLSTEKNISRTDYTAAMTKAINETDTTGKTKTTSKEVIIGNRNWIMMETVGPEYFTNSLHLLDNGKVYVIITDTNLAEAIGTVTKNYLIPVAASIEIK